MFILCAWALHVGDSIPLPFCLRQGTEGEFVRGFLRIFRGLKQMLILSYNHTPSKRHRMLDFATHYLQKCDCFTWFQRNGPVSWR